MTSLERHLQDQIDRPDSLFWHRLRLRVVAGLITDSGPAAVADIGAGAGFLGSYLAENFPSVRYYFDEELPSLESALIEKFGISANARGRRILDADLVVLLDVLEHQSDDSAFLSEILSRMRTGAQLAITVPALPILWSSWDETLGHHRRYTKNSFKKVLVDLPIEVEDLTYLFPELVVPGLIRKRLLVGGHPKTGGVSGEFPRLPAVLDRFLYGIGVISLKFRKLAPFGSSLLAVVTKTKDA